MEVIAETKNHRRTRAGIQSREEILLSEEMLQKEKLLLNLFRLREKESYIFPEIKQVTGCLEEASKGSRR